MKRFKTFLKEGGNAVKNVVRIKKEYVKPIFNRFYQLILKPLGLKKSETTFLGSTGKKKDSGDMDVAIDYTAIFKRSKTIKTIDDLYDKIIQILKQNHIDYKDMRQMGLISLAFPIYDENGKNYYIDYDKRGENKIVARVQIDIMPTDNLEYVSWSYYSPTEEESKWKGLYRNEILYAIAKYMDFKVLKKAFDKEGKEIPTEWERYFFDLSKGLLKGRQTRIGKKGNIIKSIKTIEKKVIEKNPDMITQMLFGPNVRANDVLTWEDAWELIHRPDFPYKNKLKDILKMTADGILKKGYPLPDELAKEV